jgi:hypothetical protein
MIENVDFSVLGPEPGTLDYLYILKKKMDEIINLVNKWEKECIPHAHRSIPMTSAGWSMSDTLPLQREATDESKA